MKKHPGVKMPKKEPVSPKFQKLTKYVAEKQSPQEQFSDFTPMEKDAEEVFKLRKKAEKKKDNVVYEND